MIAADIQVSLPLVSRRTPGVAAARLVARAGFGAIVVADDDGVPAVLVSASDVLRLALPAESAPTVGDLLDDRATAATPILRVEPGESVDVVASRMAEARVVVAAVDTDARSPRFVLLPVVLDALLAMYDDD